MAKFWTAFAVIFVSFNSAYAACTNPTGDAGATFYNTSQNAVQFCDGSKWYNTGATKPSATGTACTNPASAEGTMFYNTNQNTVQFCNGNNWVNMGTQVFPSATGTACTNPTGSEGSIFYNTTSKTLQFCNGDNWANATFLDANRFIPFAFAIGDGTNQYQGFNAIDSDLNGNIYAVGSTSSIAGHKSDIYIAKFDKTGSKVWDKIIGNVNNDLVERMTLDASGNIYILGRKTLSLTSQYHAFIIKLNTNGTIIWDKVLQYFDWPKDIKLDNVGNIYIAGKTNYNSVPNGDDGYITKLNNNGAIIWQKKLGGKDTEHLFALSLDSNNNIYVAGYTDSDGAGNFDYFIAKLDNTGSVLWDKTLGDSENQFANDLVIDTANNIYITGMSRNSSNNEDIYVAKLNNSGSVLWDKKLSGNQGEEPARLALDSNGNIFISGYTRSDGAGASDGIIFKLNNNGSIIWDKTFGGSQNDRIFDIHVNANDHIYLAGETGNNTATSNDAFIFSLDNNSNGCNFISKFQLSDASDADTESTLGWGTQDAPDADTESTPPLTTTDSIPNIENNPTFTVTNLCQ